MTPATAYLDTPDRWDALARALLDRGLAGLDTEFDGVDIKRQSPVGRARVYVWSVSLLTSELSPRGFHRARGCVLPAAALDHPGLRHALEGGGVRWAVHNQSADQHALANHGVRLRGAIDTLSLARWTHPGLVNTPDRFGLKNLMTHLLGRTPFLSYKELVADTETVVIERTKRRTVTVCSCGEPGCRKKIGHLKHQEERDEVARREKTQRVEIPLRDIGPGHPRWERLLTYAADDAVAALELYDLCTRARNPTCELWTDGRPGYSQNATDAVVEMEAVGVPIDVVYCERQLNAARAHEELALLELRTRWRTMGLEERTDVKIDAVWSSPKQRLELFDLLGYPRSPVWKLGRVKRGEAKVDGAAQAWIAENHPPARVLMDVLLRLQRIRAGIKYLTKLAASGGLVHPVCGPAGDEDGRSGAVTGRLGIKGELELQQMPNRKEVDPYRVKCGIVPWSSATKSKPGGWRVCLQVHDSLVLRNVTRPDVVINADYRALEMVILADLALRLFNDDQLARMITPGAPDIHIANAKVVFGYELDWRHPGGTRWTDLSDDEFKSDPWCARLRDMIKTVWYGLQYGKGGYGFSTLRGADGRPIGEETGTRLVEALLDGVPALRSWQGWCQRHVDRHRGIGSLGGRWCDLTDETADGAPDWLRRRAYRRAYNFPMQATGAEIVGDAMVRVARCEELHGPDTTVERAEELLRGCMVSATANGVKLLVPLQVEVGHGETYADA